MNLAGKSSNTILFYTWIAFAYMLLFTFSDLMHYNNAIFARIVNNFWRTLYVFILNYILFEYAWPFITKKRKYIIYNILLGLFLFQVFLMFYSFGLYAWRYFGIGIGIYTSLATYKDVYDGTTHNIGYSIGSIFFFGVLKHIFDYYKLKQSAQLLRIEKQQAELSYLKSQTNPHFLFNTLNNIYSLSREKSDLAPESILKLSKILRFMLYETSGNYIAIEQEIKIMNDYLALEKLRYDESLHINFNYTIEDMRQAVPPLLLMPLVENAFKHGVSETRSRPFVDIHLSVNNRQLIFIVKNSFDNSEEQKNIKENIGLSNLRRQLELLYKDYQLSINQEAAVFIAELKINLVSHV
jgi:two-component system LytT family sensor kinase